MTHIVQTHVVQGLTIMKACWVLLNMVLYIFVGYPGIFIFFISFNPKKNLWGGCSYSHWAKWRNLDLEFSQLNTWQSCFETRSSDFIINIFLIFHRCICEEFKLKVYLTWNHYHILKSIKGGCIKKNSVP